MIRKYLKNFDQARGFSFCEGGLVWDLELRLLPTLAVNDDKKDPPKQIRSASAQLSQRESPS